MFNSTNTPFTMPVMPATGGYADGAGWGDGGWLWIIVVFALLFGWGNNGFGNGFGNGGGYAATVATQADIQRGFDTQNIVGKLDGINNGLCDGFYAQNTALMNGFHGIDNAICNLGYQTQQGFNTTNVALMQGQNTLQAQLADCCCQNREAISQVRFDMAQDTCALQNTMNTNTRDIVENQNAGTRAILDYLCAKENADLRDKVQKLELAASQDRQNALLTTSMTAQTNQIINAVNPAPIPAYQVPNPNVYYGCGNGCGC
nr:MAG TPA: hypothetical protein [Bacteriophage sp.]